MARQIELGLDFFDPSAEPLVHREIFTGSGEIMQSSCKVLPRVLLERLPGKLLNAAVCYLPELVVTPGPASDSNHGIVGREQSIEHQIVKSRQELAPGEIPGPPENNEGTGFDLCTGVGLSRQGLLVLCGSCHLIPLRLTLITV